MIDSSKDKREQVVEYVNKYFDMSPHEHIQKIQMSCRTYARSVLTETVLYEHGPESLAIVGMVEAFQALTDNVIRNIDDEQKKPAAEEAFTLYCTCISKGIEMGEWTVNEAQKRITSFHKLCGLM